MYLVKTKNKKIIAEIHFLTKNKKINNNSVVKLISSCLLKCYSEIPLLNKKIAIYYTEDSFIKDKMKGVYGHAWDNVVNLQINPKKGWKDWLVNIIAHEYSHLAVLDVRKWEILADSLIIEGIAENFREEIIGGKKAPWTQALTRDESVKLLKKIKNKLKSTSTQIYNSLFFGSKDFKMWSGYTLGYFIVRNFRKKHPKMKWGDIIKMNSLELLKKSGFGS